MLLDICTELLEDVRNGWEYRELETEENTENGYILEGLKYEHETLIYYVISVPKNEEETETSCCIICDNKKELINLSPEQLENICNEAFVEI